ncbi:MAG: outer membrane beta-barrel protein [Bacteroidia bacterium]|nr:PorT family protein [Bacteroidia bacterium]MDW8134845.1 outer membrane beta-barrel protein [Bacteroidia bacterium]
MRASILVGCIFLTSGWAQEKVPQIWYAPRAGVNWGQYLKENKEELFSRSYWGGGAYGGLALQYGLPPKGWWAVQGEIGFVQRRSKEKNLYEEIQYNLWSTDLGVYGVWRWIRRFEALFLEAGPSTSLIVYGSYWQKNLTTGEIETRKVQFGRGSTREVRRGEVSLNVGIGAGYLLGPGYLTLGMRFWHGANNLAGGLLRRWQNYGVIFLLSYWYDDRLRESD